MSDPSILFKGTVWLRLLPLAICLGRHSAYLNGGVLTAVSFLRNKCAVSGQIFFHASSLPMAFSFPPIAAVGSLFERASQRTIESTVTACAKIHDGTL
jgi:hypothetical protein